MAWWLVLGLLGAAAGQAVRLCCPRGTAYKDNPDYDYDNYDEDIAPRTCQPHAEDELVWGAPSITLEGEGRFECASDKWLEPRNEGVLSSEILPTGDLQVKLENQTLNYSNGSFCLYFTNAGEPEDAPLRTFFSVCVSEYDVDEQHEAELTQKFYPVLIFISTFFIFVTLVVYCVLRENRSKLFGKLTIGFLLNIFLAFLFTGISYALNTRVNTDYLHDPRRSVSFCKALGFIIQHTWVAFFFWMSSMAINITYTFSQSFRHSKAQDRNQTKDLILHILYAQGLPLLITVVTIIMDNQEPGPGKILPNMGVYQCFPGEMAKSDPGSFFKTPEFLYFYLIIAILIIINLICFIVTGANLVSHWSKAKAMKKSKNNNTPFEHAKILGSLFVIMGGPWMFEVISEYVKQTSPGAFNARLALDIITLLQGILIFLALVCKTQVLRPLKKSITSGFKSSQRSDATATSKTSTVSMSSTRSNTTRMTRQSVSMDSNI